MPESQSGVWSPEGEGQQPPPRPSHRVGVLFDPETQAVSLEFSPADLKTWDYVVSLLEMGLSEAKFRLSMARAAGAQKAQRDMAAHQAVMAEQHRRISAAGRR